MKCLKKRKMKVIKYMIKTILIILFIIILIVIYAACKVSGEITRQEEFEKDSKLYDSIMKND